MERAPGGTVDVTAIALATEGVVREAVEDGTAATTAAAAAAAAAAATAVAFKASEVWCWCCCCCELFVWLVLKLVGWVCRL